MKLRFVLILNFLIFVAPQLWAQQDKGATTPNYNISGNAYIHSQYVDRGLAISDRNPSMSSAFMFHLGSQFKLGFWGTNISNMSNIDDNFWFKFIGEIRVDFSNKSAMEIYLHDDHFYKAGVRNGQRIGTNIYYNWYTFKLEWMNNFEGSNTNATYLNVGRSFVFRKIFTVGGKVGLTLETSDAFKNYIDLKGFIAYQMTDNSTIESGATYVLESSQFGSRADPAAYLTIGLTY